MKSEYLPKDQRKTILLLSDDLRFPSGVGVMSREIVLHTAHRYNWVQVGASMQHPEMGKIVDASESLSGDAGIPDASLIIYPYTGYGDPALIRHIMATEKPDAIMHFTDPRFWIWLYQMEHEIREHVPLMFYHVWDDLPFPKYNEAFYRSCDWIAGISKQTYNIVRQVWKKDAPADWQVSYIPHGVPETQFYRYTEQADIDRLAEVRKNVFGGADVKFTVLYNNRNIRRKMTGDVILAYQKFLRSLPEEDREGCRLLLHTQPVDENGTDLIALINDVAPDIKVVFSAERVDTKTMNDLYNISDVVINLASNEGFGIGTLEAMMTETMIVANVTGGLQDQMGFVDGEGNYLDPDVHYNADWGSNHDGKYTQHGEWVIPCYPVQRALIGSPPTPYIFDDRCSWDDAADALSTIYHLTPEERNRRGALGREYALTIGMNSAAMGEAFIKGIDTVLANWKPTKRFGLYTP